MRSSSDRRWFSLSEFAKRLGGEVHGGHISCPGPGHSRHDRSLSVRFTDSDNFTVHSFAGDDWQLCMDHVRTVCGLPQYESRDERDVARWYQSISNRRVEAASARQRGELARRIWDEAVDPRGTLVEAYLVGRGLQLPDEVAMRTLRFHGACPFRAEQGERLFLPATIARYSPIAHDYEPEAPPTAIHRTALKADGSGHLGKRMLGSVLGQCIKLDADEDVADGLHIAEGIETSLAAYTLGFRPIWATTTAGCMRTFPLLGGIETLTILADHDETGLDAAQACAERWANAGREAFIRWPKELGCDYADEARS